MRFVALRPPKVELGTVCGAGQAGNGEQLLRAKIDLCPRGIDCLVAQRPEQMGEAAADCRAVLFEYRLRRHEVVNDIGTAAILIGA